MFTLYRTALTWSSGEFPETSLSRKETCLRRIDDCAQVKKHFPESNRLFITLRVARHRQAR